MGALREVNNRHRLTYTVESILERATKVVEMAITHGTTAMRAFTDIERAAGTTGTRALVELRERYRGELEIQVAPFPQNLVYGRGDNSRLVEEAIAAGADVVGGMPSDEPTPELVHERVDFCLDLAKRNGLDVHMLDRRHRRPVAARARVPRMAHDPGGHGGASHMRARGRAVELRPLARRNGDQPCPRRRDLDVRERAHLADAAGAARHRARTPRHHTRR